MSKLQLEDEGVELSILNLKLKNHLKSELLNSPYQVEFQGVI